MKRTTLLTVASALIATGVISVAAAGCGDDDSAVTKTDANTPQPETSTPDTSTPDTGTTPPPVPTLGTQIDRMGRPAVNTALNAPFEADAGAQGASKDKYNQDTAFAAWKPTWAPEFSKNLAIFDGLDTVCGNQFGSTGDAAGPPIKTYGLFAGVTADDRLWIKTDATTCTTYLAVEGDAVGFNNPKTNDCGGRALSYDVIDITYSLAAKGTIIGVSDGIDKVAAKTDGVVFPYLAAPLP